MYLSPPDVHCLGPIKMELSEPQANLQAALHVLELHHSKLNTTKVNNDRAALHSSPGWLRNELQSGNSHKSFCLYRLCRCQVRRQSQKSASDTCIKFLHLNSTFLHSKLPSGISNCSLNQKARISFKFNPGLYDCELTLCHRSNLPIIPKSDKTCHWKWSW